MVIKFLYLRKNKMKKSLVFSFTDSGLFSEINNLLLTVLYCKKNGYDLLIDYSSLRCISKIHLKNIFLLDDYNTINDVIITSASTRSINTYISRQSGSKKIMYLIKYYFHIIRFYISSNIHNYNYELFQNHFNKIRELRLSLSENDKNFIFQTVDNIWNFDSFSASTIHTNFVGAHIRRGDKITETEFISLDLFYREIIDKCKINNTKNVVLFTDFLGDGIKLKDMLFGYNVKVKSLDEEGYFHEEFLKQSDITKNDKTLKLCNIVHEMSLATHFIGSNDANLSAFICLLRKGKKITDLRDGGLIIY